MDEEKDGNRSGMNMAKMNDRQVAIERNLIDREGILRV